MQTELTSNNGISNLSISTTLQLQSNRIELRFVIKGGLDEYLFPQKSKQIRANELWKATCFELFLANGQKEDYYELNFSSSLAWNFYYLSAYRAEVQEVELLSEPKIETHIKEDAFQISFELEVEACLLEQFDIYNVTSILLTQENERTFWSEKHLTVVPDFHHRDNFLEIK